MRLGGKGAMRTRQESRRLNSFGSMWTPGDKIRVFYPIFTELVNVADEGEEPIMKSVTDVLIGECWGHDIDIKEIGLKRIFIPSNSPIVDGHPTTPDALFRFSRLAKLFLDGQHEAKLAELASKKKLPEATKQTILTKIESEYKDAKPVVGRLRLYSSTECVVVPLSSDDVPLVEKMALVTQDMKDSKLNALYAIMADPQFKVSPDAKYLEVTYTFGTTGKKKDDGRVSPTGVSEAYSLKTGHPELWGQIAQLLTSLPDSSDLIMKRNTNYRLMSDAAVRSGLSTYAITNSSMLESLNTEEQLERLCYNAETIRDMQIDLDEASPAFKAVSEYEAKKLLEAEETSDAPTLQSMISDKDIEEATKESDEDRDVSEESISNGLFSGDNGLGIGGLMDEPA